MLYLVSVSHHNSDGSLFQLTVQVEAPDPVAAVLAAVNEVRAQLGQRGLGPAEAVEDGTGG